MYLNKKGRWPLPQEELFLLRLGPGFTGGLVALRRDGFCNRPLAVDATVDGTAQAVAHASVTVRDVLCAEMTCHDDLSVVQLERVCVA